MGQLTHDAADLLIALLPAAAPELDLGDLLIDMSSWFSLDNLSSTKRQAQGVEFVVEI